MKCRAMTRIMHICIVLVVMVSVFFYVPMEVKASSVESVYLDKQINFVSSTYNAPVDLSFGRVNLVEGLDSNSFYQVFCDIEFDILQEPYANNWFRNLSLIYAGNYIPFNAESSLEDNSGYRLHHFVSKNVPFYQYGKYFVNQNMNLVGRVNSSVTGEFTYDINIKFSNFVINQLTGEESESYQQGYNAGYSAGEQAGESNGYSLGYSDGYEAGEQSGYDSGFQAGSDSVDTQSYYDAGYSAGYDAGYATGYDTGYDEGYDAGWSAYEAQMDKWGADISDYPLLLSEINDFDLQFTFIEVGTDESVISTYDDSERFWPDNFFNPNHTYKLDFTYQNLTYDYDSYFTSAFSFWLYWGDCSYPLLVYSGNDNLTTSFFISGDKVGNVLRFRCDIGNIESNGSFEVLRYFINGCSLKLYDMGPSGDTQNHIANQTDQLTNGYDSSQGAAVNDDFKASVNEYHTAEDSLFSTATTSLENFTFLDFTSITGMVTSLSFVTSIMTSIYMAMGGDTGASGIILAVLFSVMLVSMAIGLYRYYVSNGKSDGSGKGGD